MHSLTSPTVLSRNIIKAHVRPLIPLELLCFFLPIDIFWGIKNWAKATLVQFDSPVLVMKNTCMAWLNAAAMSVLCIYGNVFKFPNTSYTGILVDSDWSRFSMKHDLRIVPKKKTILSCNTLKFYTSLVKHTINCSQCYS